MSPTLHHFGSAAEGRIPQNGSATGMVMGKPVANGSISALAEMIGQGIELGRIDPPGAAAKLAQGVNLEIATPGGGAHKIEGVAYTVNYKEDPVKNESLFMGRQDTLTTKPGL